MCKGSVLLDRDTMKKIISIVVTYNGIKWVERCIGSLVGSHYPVEVIVVDNGSKDATLDIIRERFPVVHIIETKTNLGFGQANNIGLRIAVEKNADYVFLLNQDAWVEKNTMEGLVQVLEGNPAFGILSPLHLDGSGQKPDQYFLEYFKKSHITEYISAFFFPDKDAPSLIETNFVNAAAWCISRDCLKKTGGFAPIFFHYGEDMDYMQRALSHGFKAGIYLQERIYHDRADRTASLNSKMSPEKEWIHILNQVCDIGQKKYKQILVKRILRYGLLSFTDIIRFDGKSFRRHAGLAGKILGSLKKISKTRMESLSGKPYPHLSQ